MTRDEREMMSLIRRRVDAGYPMTQIAHELGEDVDDLCAWIMAYKDPRPNTSIKRDGPPIALRDATVKRYPWSASQNAQRFANWKRAHEGAKAARGE